MSRFIQPLTGVNAGCVFVLESETVIGRGANADVLVVDPQASRAHARLDLDGDGHTILRDLGSSNGTFVEDKPVKVHRLRRGDKFLVGTTLFVYGEVDGEIQGLDGLRKAIKVFSLRVMVDPTIDQEGIEEAREQLGEIDTLTGQHDTGELCTHELARTSGWPYCPDCGRAIAGSGG